MDIKLIPEREVSNPNDYKNFKIIVIGDSGVGAIHILRRAVKNKFDESYQSTFESILLYFIVNNNKIKLTIWNTCVDELFRSLVQGFYRNIVFCLCLSIYIIFSSIL